MAHPEPLLRTSVRRTASGAVLRLSGEADLSTEARLRMRLSDLVDGGPPVGELVVDVTGLEFLDLACLDALCDAARAQRRRGGRFVLRRPTRRVRRLLTVLRVDLPVED